MDTEKTRTAEIEWVLCSPNFENIVYIAPKWLNSFQIDSHYQETLIRNIQRVYFNYIKAAQKQTMKKHN